MKKRKIYVASSWRNDRQPIIVGMLRAAGHEVYDFRNPKEGDKGFHWSDIDPDWQDWSMEEYSHCLNHPIANAGFESDFDAMLWADTFIGVMPFGRSASLEMGWAAGCTDKETILLLSDGEPELMVKMLDHVVCGWNEIIEIIGKKESQND